jgi:hypothetical protein
LHVAQSVSLSFLSRDCFMKSEPLPPQWSNLKTRNSAIKMM